jgi:hypothetical protein
VVVYASIGTGYGCVAARVDDDDPLGRWSRGLEKVRGSSHPSTDHFPLALLDPRLDRQSHIHRTLLGRVEHVFVACQQGTASSISESCVRPRVMDGIPRSSSLRRLYGITPNGHGPSALASTARLPGQSREDDPAAQAAFMEKKWVWVPDDEKGYLAAWVVSEEAGEAVVRVTDDDSVSFLLSSAAVLTRFPDKAFGWTGRPGRFQRMTSQR